MAVESTSLHDGTLTASADLQTTPKQFYAVVISGDNTVDLCSTTGAKCYGLLQNKPASGDAADVTIFGTSKAVIGGTVTANANLIAGNDGKLYAYTNAGVIVAIAREGGSASDIISVRVLPAAA